MWTLTAFTVNAMQFIHIDDKVKILIKRFES
jgi:hypothetical protein